MEAVGTLKGIVIYLGILVAFFLTLYFIYRIFMWLVLSFGDSVSYNVYNPTKVKKQKSPHSK
jgi:hypothetical protein